MTVAWSRHAQEQRNDILCNIGYELSYADAVRWADKFHEAAHQIADFPNLGAAVPDECFYIVPDNIDQLQQIIVKPYRIVYEALADEIHILSIRHSRMLVTADDTRWH